jgi:nicotinamide-nucleotide amidase
LTARRPRAAILVTGSELVRGDRTDLNGPFLAREALALGFEPARVTIVGDGEAELEPALREGLEADLLLVSGGLGPTHDDRTVELLARVAGRPLVVDDALESEIAAIARGFAAQRSRPYAEFEPGVRKQATVPEGAVVLGVAGTAPGLALELGETVVVVLPGPPGELQRLWRVAVDSASVRRVRERARPPDRRVMQLFGINESAVARALEAAGGEPEGVEVTVCARDFEVHVDLVVEPGHERAADDLERSLDAALSRYVFARDGRTVEELVLALCRAEGLTLTTAESCTGGLVAARLTAVPGASDVFLGGVIAYADSVKHAELGVPERVLSQHGAVSAESAAAMAAGARERLGADVAVAVTGIAGPGGGTAEKPVGLVYVHAAGPRGERAADFAYPADRETVRRRAAATALHLVRRLLSQDRHGPG